MKTTRYSTILLTAPILTFPIASATAQKWEKYIDKAEAIFEEGNYKKSLKQISKLKAKSTQKLGPSNKYLALGYVKEAKNNIALGRFSGVEKQIQKGVEMSLKVNGENSGDHLLLVIEVSELYIQFGNYRKADEFVARIEEVMEGSGIDFEDFKADVDLKNAIILSGKGFYSDALKLIDNREAFYNGRAVSKESYVDEQTGKLVTVKVPEDQRVKRLRDFGRLMSLKANTLNKMGAFVASDSAFLVADNWLDKNLGRSDLAYLENLYYWAKMLEDNGVEGKLPIKYYERATTRLKGKYKLTHNLNLKVEQRLIRAYSRSGDKGKLNQERTAYKKAALYYGNSSLHSLMEDALELDLKLNADRTKNLEKNARRIMSNTKVFPKYHPDRINFLKFVYKTELVNQDYDGAENNLNEILAIKAELYGEETPEHSLSMIDLANHYLRYKDKIAEAEEIYDRHFFDNLELLIEPGHVGYVDMLYGLSEIYESSDRYELASKSLDRALGAIRAKYDNEDPAYAAALDRISNLQIRIGEYEKADLNIKIALEIFKNSKVSSRPAYAKALETQAKVMAIYSLYDEAEDAFNRSQKLLGKVRATDRIATQSSIEELASLYIDIGKFSLTEDLLTEAIQKYEEQFGPGSRKLLTPLLENARLELITGDYSRAEKFASRANRIAESVFGGASTKTAATLIVLSQINTTIGDYERAHENIDRALKIQTDQFGEDHVDVAKSLSQLAQIKYYQHESFEEIEPLYLRSQEVVESKLGPLSPLYAETLKNRAALYIRVHQVDDAFELLDQAERIWERKLGRRNNINLASIYTLSGDIFYLRRNFEAANERYKKAKRLYEKVFNDSHPDYVKVLAKMSKVSYMMGDAKDTKKYIDEALLNYNDFIKVYFPALSEREKAKFWNTIKPEFEFFNTLAAKLRYSNPRILADVYNNALTTKSLLLSSSIKMRERILNSNDEDLKIKYSEWIDKKELMTRVLSMSLEELIQNEIEPGTLAKEVELLERELSQKSELFSQSFEDKRITWEDVRSSLQENEVAMEMVRFRFFDHVFTDSVLYALLYVKSDSDIPEMLLLNNGKDLEFKYLHYFRNSVKYKVRDQFSADHFWKPIAERVGDFSTIYLSADGVYNQINLEAIPIGDEKYVLDNSNIILVGNTKDLYLRTQRADRQNYEENQAIMFGNPQFYVSTSSDILPPSKVISQLPGTQKEVERLSDLLNTEGWATTDYLQDEASEEQIKNLQNPMVFHIATHGFFTPDEEIEVNEEEIEMNEARAVQNPLLRTGLLLAGAGDLLSKTTYNYNMESGILTAYEAINLNLDNTDLVVLSACETGLGDLEVGEGVYGLQRAFLVAGARTLIMSLFKVPDEATQKLMVRFYEKWVETGLKRESFIEAKKEIRNEYHHPYYWGAFIMMGLD